MARGMVQTRVELEQQVDASIRKIMRAESRNSKREMMAVLLQRISRAWDRNPQTLVQFGLVKSEDHDGQHGQLLQRPA